MPSRFSNPWGNHDPQPSDILKLLLGRGPKDHFITTADSPAPAIPCSPQAPPAAGWRITWLGHSSFLLQGTGRSILVDPVFSDYCSPFPIKALRRRVPPACELDQLPPIEAVLLTHSHYDHLDLSTLKTLGSEMPLVVPQGHSAWLGRKGFRHVRELGWFENAEIFPGLRVTATPGQHFTARTPFDRNRAHWCGWLLEGGGVKLWHAGDSGYCPAFREIGTRLGPIDFGMIPIGAYSPRWFMESMHMNPEEAVTVYQETHCRQAVAMHWGTFRLTREPMEEPVLRLQGALDKTGIAREAFATWPVGGICEILPAESQPRMDTDKHG